MNFFSTNACIADSLGNNLFYTNGYYIANAANDTMLSGNNLIKNIWTQYDTMGVNSEQGALILPMPGENFKYYLFHAPWSGQGQDDWFYSIIDMTQDGGLGAVISQNNLLIHDSLVRGKITACRHANGRDWWIVFPRFNSQLFYEFLITPYGLTGPYTLNPGGAVRSSAGVGQVCFSRDGRRYAYYDPYQDLDLFDFDRCSGTFSNLLHINFYDSADVGGVAFSSNSNILYVSSNTFIYQFDLTSGNIPSTQLTVAVWDSFFSPSPPFATTFYLEWLAPDNKIYIVCGNGTQDIHRINSPNSVGLACDVQQHSVHLTAYNAFTIPQNVNYFLGADTSSVICDTINAIHFLPVQFEDRFTIFPNPAIHEAKLHYNIFTEKGSFIIFNAFGERIASFKLNGQETSFEFDVREFTPGIYLYQIVIDGESQKSGKFIIQK
ncbi:MAG: T9SS type A sorting domain-containing protein [Bacteroidota bacterium]